MTGGIVAGDGTRAASDNIPGGARGRSRKHRLPQNLQGKQPTSMMRKSPNMNVLPPSAGTSGVEDLPKRSSKSGQTISTASERSVSLFYSYGKMGSRIASP